MSYADLNNVFNDDADLSLASVNFDCLPDSELEGEPDFT